MAKLQTLNSMDAFRSMRSNSSLLSLRSASTSSPRASSFDTLPSAEWATPELSSATHTGASSTCSSPLPLAGQLVSHNLPLLPGANPRVELCPGWRYAKRTWRAAASTSQEPIPPTLRASSHLTCRLSHVIGALKVCAYGANGAEVKKVGFLHAIADSVAAPC